MATRSKAIPDESCSSLVPESPEAEAGASHSLPASLRGDAGPRSRMLGSAAFLKLATAATLARFVAALGLHLCGFFEESEVTRQARSCIWLRVCLLGCSAFVLALLALSGSLSLVVPSRDSLAFVQIEPRPSAFDAMRRPFDAVAGLRSCDFDWNVHAPDCPHSVRLSRGFLPKGVSAQGDFG